MDNMLSVQAAPATAVSLVEELARQQWRGYPFRLENFPAGRQIVESDAETQARAAAAIVRWLSARGSTFDSNSWKMRQALFVLLKRKLPLTEADLMALVDWSIHVRNNQWRGLPQIIKIVGDYLKENELKHHLAGKLEELVEAVEAERASAEVQRQVLRLNELAGKKEIRLPMEAGDVWANAALIDIRGMSGDEQNIWGQLLLHCLRATGSAPSKKWLKDARALVIQIGVEDFRSAVLRWFPLADRARPAESSKDELETLLPVNADLLKGLAWLCSGFEQAEVARALANLALSAYRRLPGRGPRAVKIGNACFWALGSMPGAEGLAQLSILKARIKGTSPQKVIAAAIDLAATRSGMSKEEAEELGVPTYGMEAVGRKTYSFGEVMTHVEIAGSSVEQTWERGGERLAWEPKEVRDEHAEELEEIEETVKDIRKMLLAQRDRIDGLYLSPRKWRLADWRKRYLDHPIVGTVARRLIWKFSRGDRAESGIWHNGQIVGRDDEPIGWLDETTTVELWHPISVASEVVVAWRNWLEAHQVQQPFKQAHREIYPLTDAERATRTYSNRYAAHILRQHQFNALCAARGWKNALRLMVDSEFPPATRTLSQWGLRAEFWIEGIGDLHDTNPTGAFLYLTTDQVRFYRSDAIQNRSHARSGAYYARRWNGRGNAEPLALETIPELVFSEIMRDVDLFVGVASIGNDPNWLDGGDQVRYRDYWHGYSFGDLTESAKTRKQVLETLLPRLKIAGRCELTDKFLVVRGDIRTYKIHMGSSNILMEPNDQYLCIVPTRVKGVKERENLYLPFEGDHTLAVILSKAFLLAEDTKITDPTIIRQLKR
jgi:hypothetical protein